MGDQPVVPSHDPNLPTRPQLGVVADRTVQRYPVARVLRLMRAR